MREDGVVTAALTLTPTTVVAGGDAMARDADGRVVFVTGGLPGETVEVEITETKRDFRRAITVRVVEPSAHRQAPPCPRVLDGCGGCSWQHIDSDYQRQLKLGIVRDALRRTARLPDAEVRLAPALPTSAFRTSLRMAVDPNGRLAYRRESSHELVTVDDCLVAHPGLIEMLRDGRFPIGSEVSLRISAATGERTVLVEAAEGGATSPVRVPEGVRIGPNARLTEVIAGARFSVSASSFFQTRSDGAEALVTAVRAALRGPIVGPWVDAYGGVGLFSVTLGGRATLVESAVSSCADARRNVSKDVEVVQRRFEQWKPTPASVIVADPPRSGLGKAAIPVVVGTGAERLVLVSCDPVSLARDAALLDASGFRHEGSVVVDLFPHTSHVEVVTRFVRG